MLNSLIADNRVLYFKKVTEHIDLKAAGIKYYDYNLSIGLYLCKVKSLQLTRIKLGCVR